MELPVDSQRLIAFLAIRRGRLRRSQVAGSLWLDCTQDQAFSNLRTALWRLRRTTKAVVHADAKTVALEDRIEVDVDAVDTAATRLCSKVVVAADAWDWRLFAKELLPGWCDEWAVVERERVRQLSLHALEAMSERMLSEGLWGSAIQAALAAVNLDPLRESSRRCLISIHLAEGNRSEAIRAYDEYADLLRREIGIDPSPKLVELMPL